MDTNLPNCSGFESISKKGCCSISNWPLFYGLSDIDIQKVVSAATERMFKSGESLCIQGEVGASMFVILYGRVRMTIKQVDGNEQILNTLQQGDHFGELILLIGGQRTATASALMDTMVMEIPKQSFHDLVKQVPQFSINLSRSIGNWLHGQLTRKVVRKRLGIIGLIRTSELTSFSAQQIIRFFTDRNKRIELFSDRTTFWEFMGSDQLHKISGAAHNIDVAQLKLRLTEAAERSDHVFIDIAIENVIPKLLMQCERTWWFVEQNNTTEVAEVALAEQISNLLEQQPELKKRLQIIWVQQKSYNLVKVSRHIAATDFEALHCVYDAKTKDLRPADLARLYHIARGVHLGLALGGGGAHGLAHIGVLAALEENGLFFDRFAGTSAGAIIAGGHGAGFDQQHLLDLFSKEMQPPGFMKYIPKGSKWHLMGLFRFGLVEQRFRKYLKDLKLEQLLVPVHMVSVDLISGTEVVRSNGDVVSCMLESINYPIYCKPIFRDGLALVDGGVLINVPSSVLRKQQADYIVAVDIGTKLLPSFGKNTPGTPTEEMKHAGYFSTLSRVLDVSTHELAKLHMLDSDFLISPDTSSCPFEDFTRGEELFEIGYTAAQNVMPELKRSYENFVEQE